MSAELKYNFEDMCNHRNLYAIPDIPSKYSSLPKFIFEAMLQCTANANIYNEENLTSVSLPESQKKKYPCPPSIENILNRDSYEPPTFLDDLISVANAQAKGQWRNGRKHYIEAGGWILINSNGSKFHYHIKPVEEQDYSTGVFMNDQEIQKYVGDYLKKGWLIITEFHTHSDSGNTTHQGDTNRANERLIPGFIIDLNSKTFRYGDYEKGIYKVGIPKDCT